MAEQVTEKEKPVVPHSQFAVWMREFSFGQDDLLVERWKAVKTLADNAGDDDVETFIRLAFKSRQLPDQSHLEKIEKAFQTKDPGFSARDNARELQVLSAACLVHLAESGNNETAPTAALALSTSLFAGIRKPSLPMDIHILSANALQALSAQAGKRMSLPQPSAPSKVTFEPAAQKVTTQGDFPTVAAAFTLAGVTANTAFLAQHRQHTNTIAILERTLRQQDEELQMLWWTIGGRSEVLDCAFDAIPPNLQPLTLAKELADHTTVLPGPRSASTLLLKAGLPDKGKVALTAAINECKSDWLRYLVQHHVPCSPVTTPIHYAIERQLETGAGPDWVAGWAAATELPKSVSLSPLLLAELFYRERLLLGESS